MMAEPAPANPPIEYRRARMRLWMFLWIIATAWVLSMLGIPNGLVPWWLFGVITAGAFIGLWWLNSRIVTMERRREAGRCWKCGVIEDDPESYDPPTCPQCDYDLKGVQSDRCPECGRKLNWTLGDECAACARARRTVA